MVAHHPAAPRIASLLVASLLCSAAPALPARAAHPRKDKTLCKQIQQAVRDGRTLEQITTDLQVNAQQVTACIQAKGKRRKPQATTPAASTHTGSTSARQRRIAKAGTPAKPPSH